MKTRGTTSTGAIAAPAPLLSIDGIAEYLGVSRRTIERDRSAGRLPEPDKIAGRKMPRWRRSTIEAWIDGEKGGC